MDGKQQQRETTVSTLWPDEKKEKSAEEGLMSYQLVGQKIYTGRMISHNTWAKLLEEKRRKDWRMHVKHKARKYATYQNSQESARKKQVEKISSEH